MSLKIALTTYSVKPRGGVVHTLELAEALNAGGVDASVIAMGDPAIGFYRDVDAPVHIIAAPDWSESLEDRVFSWIDAMSTGLAALAPQFDIVHSQDCISARAAVRVRRNRSDFAIVRTVHHVDDFTTQALIDCQAAAIHEPDHVFVVSEMWRRRLLDEYGVEATVVQNGVRIERFDQSGTDAATRSAFRESVGAETRHIFLTVGGIEPRKGSRHLIDAFAALVANMRPDERPVLVIVGGHSFQDYRDYREDVLGSLPRNGLELGSDVVLVGTVSDSDLTRWFHAADTFVFPSINEGWGLVILEALAAGLPVVASDIEVFQEFLTDDVNAVLTAAADPVSLVTGMSRVMNDHDLTERLRTAGRVVAEKYSWSTSARHHNSLYSAILREAVRTD